MPYHQRSRRHWRRHLVTPEDVARANRAVTRELEALGLSGPRLEAVEVRWVPASFVCYGWFQNHIYIPGVTGAHVVDFIRGNFTSLRDVLRHEWAHAVAAHWPGFVGTRRFARDFGGEYESYEPVAAYTPQRHLTTYAASSPCEDFAEVFHFYLKHRGILPDRYRLLPGIWRKWDFIACLAYRISGTRRPHRIRFTAS